MAERTHMSMPLLLNDMDIDLGDVVLHGDLHVPEGARGLVLFAHGSGSSRKSVRNRMVAGVLEAAGIGTFLFDLLTRQEDEVDDLRFDITLLSTRLKRSRTLCMRTCGCGTCPSVCSVRARERLRRSMPRRPCRTWSRRWSPAAAGPIWRWMRAPAYRRPPC